MTSSQGFQSQVNQLPAPGVVGDFCTLNPMYSFAGAGPGGFVAGPSGVVVGRFVWPEWNYLDPDNNPTVVNNSGLGLPIGIVGRRQQGIIVTWLTEAGLTIQSGQPLGVLSAADLWVLNSGTTTAIQGMKAYANFANGTIAFAATGAPTTSSATGSSVAAETFSVTGSVAGNVLTVTAVASGTVYPGSTISGTGITTGAMIATQLSGTTGGVGTYALTIGDMTAAATTVSGTYGLLTIGTLTGAQFAVGDIISGSSVVTGTTITYSVTGGASSGTMVVNNNTVVSSTTITAASNIETGWYCQSQGNAGEIVKISRLPGPYAGAAG